MAKYVQPGHIIDYVNSGAAKIAAGDVVVFGARLGIASTDIAVGATGTIALDGVFEFDKAAEALSVGDFVYWDASNKKVTATAGSNAPAGLCVNAQLSGDATARVLIGWPAPAPEPSAEA